jgi:hypothetical protein
VFASHVAILSVAVFTVLFMGGQHKPHDAVFRKILGEPANAASQLRAVLPETLVRRLDLDRLERAHPPHSWRLAPGTLEACVGFGR